jgi:hypothetical protein
MGCRDLTTYLTNEFKLHLINYIYNEVPIISRPIVAWILAVGSSKVRQGGGSLTNNFMIQVWPAPRVIRTVTKHSK